MHGQQRVVSNPAEKCARQSRITDQQIWIGLAAVYIRAFAQHILRPGLLTPIAARLQYVQLRKRFRQISVDGQRYLMTGSKAKVLKTCTISGQAAMGYDNPVLKMCCEGFASYSTVQSFLYKSIGDTTLAGTFFRRILISLCGR